MFVKLGAENHKEELATYVDIPPFLICLNVSLLDYVYFFLSLLSTAAPSPTATQKLVANYRYNCNGSHPLINELYSLASIWKCKRLSDPHQLEIHQQGFSFIAWCLIDKFFSIVVAWCANRVILIEKSLEFWFWHAAKLFSLLHWFQNCFCFRSRTFPSHVGTFFCSPVDLECENSPKRS